MELLTNSPLYISLGIDQNDNKEFRNINKSTLIEATPHPLNTSSVGTFPDGRGNHSDIHVPYDLALAGTIVGIFLIATGVFGNILVICSVVSSKQLCRASNIFIISLAACDIFQNLLVKPLYVHTYLAGKWKFGNQLCIYALFASNISILESILHTAAIALYRYVEIYSERIVWLEGGYGF